MRIELVVFDMAGTTVYDGDAVNRCLFTALARKGVHASRDEINSVMGMPKPLALASLMSHHWGRELHPDDPEVCEAYGVFEEEMLAYYREHPEVREADGATDVFQRLHGHGVKVVLDTGFNRAIAEAVCHRLGWSDVPFVNAVVTSDQVSRGRPHPDMIWRAMRLTGVTEPSKVAKVGDTPSDLVEGTAAGCGLVIGVTTGSHTRDELARHPYTHLISTVAEIPPLVLDRRLFTPGPLTTSFTVKKAMLRDLGTRDEEFVSLVRRIRRRLVELAVPDSAEQWTAVLMQGSGTFGVEAVLGSTVPSEGGVLICSNGAYGERMAQIASTLGLYHRVLQTPEDVPASEEEVREALAQDEQLTHVAVVHCETTTGILNPIEEIGPVVRSLGRTFVVDAMSSFGGIPVNLQESAIDFLISSPNKCIEGVPGFSFILARKDALQSAAGRARSLSLDLYAQWKGLESSEGQFRFTPPVQVLLAFDQALNELEAEGGIAARYARYCANHQALMHGMAQLGFRPFLAPEHQSPIIATFHNPPHPAFQFDEFYQRISDKGFTIYAGKLSRAQTFRIGTIGRLDRRDVEDLLGAVKATLDEMGVHLTPVK